MIKKKVDANEHTLKLYTLYVYQNVFSSKKLVKDNNNLVSYVMCNSSKLLMFIPNWTGNILGKIKINQLWHLGVIKVHKVMCN